MENNHAQTNEELMPVKGAYYAKGLPSVVVLVLPDNSVWAANLAPYRRLKKDELRRLPGYESAAYLKALMTDDNEVFEFVYFQYGLKKMP